MVNSNSLYSSLRKEKRINLLEDILIKGPLKIYFETINRCNYKCVYCLYSFEDYSIKSCELHFVEFEDFTRLICEIKELNSVKVLNLYMMGEPF